MNSKSGFFSSIFRKGDGHPPTPTRVARSLDLSLLKRMPNTDDVACVDFGTALSKICIVRSHKPGATTTNDVRPLQIGLQATQTGIGFLAPSSLYIVEDRIYFGDQATQKAAGHNDSTRQRFQSPKQFLSEMAEADLDVPPPASQDPTQSFKRNELMILLLAHLIWKASAAAQRQYKIGTLPKLRFARPAWDAGHAQRGEGQLLNLFARAFAIAGTLRESLVSTDGLTVAEARAALDLPHDDAALRQLLISRVQLGSDEADCIDRGFVPEATAAAAASIHPERGQRRVFVVVDVGAGTIDFGAFVTVPGQRRGRIGELTRGRAVMLRAGNFLDEQVVALLKDKAGLVDGMSVGPLARLKREAPWLKQTLFEQEEVEQDLGNGQFVGATLPELLERYPIKEFCNELWDKFEKTLSVAIEFTRGLDPAPRSVEVILTGGGSQLPMVRGLVTRAQKEARYDVIDRKSVV